MHEYITENRSSGCDESELAFVLPTVDAIAIKRFSGLFKK